MIAFTLCSNNYLAQAKTLGDSFVSSNPGVPFVVGLVDRRRDGIDYAALGPFEFLPVEEIGIPGFDEFWKHYSVIELNTAVKPFYIDYLFERDRPDVVVYLDPDIELYGSLDAVRSELGDSTILLTPHAMSPLPDEGPRVPQSGEPVFMEPAFLNYGIYNLGFLAVADKPGRSEFLDWWKTRTSRWGYAQPCLGLYVDQLWVGLAPLFFDDVRITRREGFNVAYWNLHERVLSPGPDGGQVVNGTDPLLFFHFSGLDPANPEQITKTPRNPFTLSSRPDLAELFRGYAERLLANGFDELSSLECAFAPMREAYIAEVAAAQRAESLRRAPVTYRLYLTARWVYRKLRAPFDRMSERDGLRPE